MHTPGPWEVKPSSNPNNGTSWRDIVSVSKDLPYTPMYVGEARNVDASLIAAAPDLLKAANEMAELLRCQIVGYELPITAQNTLNAARAAIAKAEGR